MTTCDLVETHLCSLAAARIFVTSSGKQWHIYNSIFAAFIRCSDEAKEEI